MGNIRLSYFKNSNGSAEVLEENNYYPFGLKHEGYNALAGNSSYKYKYNGVELQEESGMYAMDWRQYMPDLGRFSAMDMLSESYIDSTPYHFGLNNPIAFSDPTGMYTNTHNGYLFTRTDKIAGLQQYFGNGGSVGDLGGFMSGNETFKDDIQEVVVNVTGKGNKDTWNLGGNYLFNSYTLYNGILKGLNNWNFQTKAGAMSESLVGVRNDGGVIMMDSMWDALGIVIANNISSENKTAMLGLGALAIILSKGQATDEVLKAGLAVEKTEMKVLSRTQMANIWGAGPLRIDPNNLHKTVTEDFIEILAGRGTPIMRRGVHETVRDNVKWLGALEWKIRDIPGSKGLNSCRMVQHPSGKWGIVINHDYTKIIQIPTSSAVK